MTLWNYIRPQDLHGIPPGLCGCDSYWPGRPARRTAHDPKLCAEWRRFEEELDALLDPEGTE